MALRFSDLWLLPSEVSYDDGDQYLVAVHLPMGDRAYWEVHQARVKWDDEGTEWIWVDWAGDPMHFDKEHVKALIFWYECIPPFETNTQTSEGE